MDKTDIQENKGDVVYVNLHRRFLAEFLDGWIVLVLTYIICVIVYKLLLINLPLKNTWMITFFIYDILMLGFWGATFGKMFLGIRVVDEGYGKISLFDAALRETIGKGISSIFWLGFIWIAIDNKRQGWHDKIAGTYVIKD